MPARILVVDDEPPIVDVLDYNLRRANYEVLIARDGEEGVRLLQKHADRVGLLLLDVMMPGIGGVGAYHQIRQLDSNVPILLMSGYSGDAVRDLLDRDDRLDFIPKPMDPDDLLSKVRAAIEGRSGDAPTATDDPESSNLSTGGKTQ